VKRDSISTNSHLNLFNFYSEDKETLENNITRALAICLRNNKKILQSVLEKIMLPKDYLSHFTFNINNLEEEEIIIDIQKNIKDINWIEGTYNKIIGVTLTTEEFEKDLIKKINPKKRDKPIPDLLISLRDLIIIIEVKKSNDEGSIGQMKNQVLKLREEIQSENENIEVVYKSISWRYILESFMEIEDLLETKNENNIFVSDFNYFIRSNYPTWFPIQLLKEIDFSDDEENPNYKQITKRLNVIKMNTTNEYLGKEDLTDKGNRSALPLDFGWAKEANIYIEDKNEFNGDYLGLQMWVGDTKTQGKKLFKKSKELSWLEKEKLKVEDNNYSLKINPYISFTHFHRGISLLWFEGKNYKRIFNYNNFQKLAGHWERNSETRSWQELGKLFDKLFGVNWRDEVQWEEKFINTNRNYTDLVMGVKITVLIPYKKAQKLDNDKKNPKLSKEIYNILRKLRSMINNPK